MPRLRQITCQVEWPETGLQFKEYGTVYGDGLVETFIAVPEEPQAFTIHLTSKGYVAEGLAMLVYIDGEYQCNRNRLHLKQPRKGQARGQTEVDFRLRQKEKTIGGGTFIGRDWRFDFHNIVPNGQFPGDFDPSHFDRLGVIEVIVLRCRAKPGDDDASESSTHESILGEIDNFGQVGEDITAADEGAGNNQAAVMNAPKEIEELADLAGIQIDGTPDEPQHFGLDGEAPSGYWTYHPQPPPPGNDCRPDKRPEGRVHFDWGSPSGPNYSQGPPYQQQSRQAGDGYGGGSLSNRQSNWQHSVPAGHAYLFGWRPPQPPPTYPERTHLDWHTSNNSLQSHGGEAPNKYSDFGDPKPYVPPPNSTVPHQPTWIAPASAGSGHWGWNSINYPVWTPQLQFVSSPSYPATPAVYSPFHPPLYSFEGPGYAINYPVPAGRWPGDQDRQPRSHDLAKERNNRNDSSENQGTHDAWGSFNNNGSNRGNTDGGTGNTTTSGWDQAGTGGDAANISNANNDIQPNEGEQNNSEHEQTGNKGNTGWGDGNQDNNNSQTQANWDGNNAQNAETKGNWDGNNPQDSRTLGGWEANNNINIITTTTNRKAPQSQNDNKPAPSYPATGTGAIQPGFRLARPLYGPYGAYYTSSSQPHTDLSPLAQAEEEPPFDIPETVAAEKGTTHQVQLGKGYLYIHKRASPEYIDRIEEPYARFVFKYRTREQIEREVGVKIECRPTRDEEKRKFTHKTRDELIDLLVLAQNALGAKTPSPSPVSAREGNAKQEKASVVAPVPAPSAYKYLKYELPKGRNPGLGISGRGNNAPQAQQRRQSAQHGSECGADWQLSASGCDRSAPLKQQQTRQSAPNW